MATSQFITRGTHDPCIAGGGCRDPRRGTGTGRGTGSGGGEGRHHPADRLPHVGLRRTPRQAERRRSRPPVRSRTRAQSRHSEGRARRPRPRTRTDPRFRAAHPGRTQEGRVHGTVPRRLAHAPRPGSRTRHVAQAREALHPRTGRQARRRHQEGRRGPRARPLRRGLGRDQAQPQSSIEEGRQAGRRRTARLARRGHEGQADRSRGELRRAPHDAPDGADEVLGGLPRRDGRARRNRNRGAVPVLAGRSPATCRRTRPRASRDPTSSASGSARTC